MLDLNVRAASRICRLRWIDGIVKHKGGILNVASVAGFLPGPNMAVYYASKAYVLSFTEALSSELSPLGVACDRALPRPGADRIPDARRGRWQTRAALASGAPRCRSRRAGYDGFMAGKSVVIPGFGNKVMSALPRLLPRSLVLKLMGSYQRGRGRRAEGWKKRPKG